MITATDIAEFARPLVAILPRVSAMNSFLRSQSYRRWHSSLHHVVYHYKREALIQASQYGIATHRQAQVPATCRDCGGSGRYEDWSGPRDHCWRCNSSGHVRLEFVETTLPGCVWLTPKDKAWSFALRATAYKALEETANNPQINQPGHDLEPDQVAEHLNEIEAFFHTRPPKRYSDFGEFDIANTYTIWIGTTELGRCYLCHAPVDRIYGGHCVRTGRVMWNGIVGKCCDDGTVDVFKKLSPMLPREFITPPITTWIARHPVQPEMAVSRVVERYPATARTDYTEGTVDSDVPF